MQTVSPDMSVRFDQPEARRIAREKLDAFGFVVITDGYSPGELARIREVLEGIENAATEDDPGALFSCGHLWAMWDMYERSPELMRLVVKPEVFCFVAAFLDGPAESVRTTLMRKATGTTHVVGWHQDWAIPVSRDLGDKPSFGLWDRVPYRYPGPGIMDHMIAARFNLEAQAVDNGPVVVLPGSHRAGLYADAEALREYVDPHAHEAVVCPVPAGSILFYRDLLMHSSGRSTSTDPTNHRRVLHHEYRKADLVPPDDLDWWRYRNEARIDASGVYFRCNSDVEPAPTVLAG